jgi:predicted small lipoprotein YifL
MPRRPAGLLAGGQGVRSDPESEGFEEKYRAVIEWERSIFVWCRRIGDFIVNRNYSPRPSGWAIILLSAAVLALAGCGRKGGLDLPPTASSAAVAAPADTDAEEAGRPSVFNPYYGTDAPPAATKGRKKPFVLDPLLND